MIYLMNPLTGSVAPEEEWRADFNSCRDAEDRRLLGWPERFEDATLYPVVPNNEDAGDYDPEYGAWRPADPNWYRYGYVAEGEEPDSELEYNYVVRSDAPVAGLYLMYGDPDDIAATIRNRLTDKEWEDCWVQVFYASGPRGPLLQHDQLGLVCEKDAGETDWRWAESY